MLHKQGESKVLSGGSPAKKLALPPFKAPATMKEQTRFKTMTDRVESHLTQKKENDYFRGIVSNFTTSPYMHQR